DRPSAAADAAAPEAAAADAAAADAAAAATAAADAAAAPPPPLSPPARPRPAPRRRRKRLRAFSILRLLFLLLVYGASLGAATLYYVVMTINDELPKDLSQLLDYQPNRKSVVLSSDGDEVGAFSIENRRIVALERMPPHVPAAFISAEDGRFFSHKGFDLLGIGRAAIKNFRGGGGIRQGGSTITQQIIKQTLLAGEENIGDLDLDSEEAYARIAKLVKYRRKMKELILAVRLERELTKAEILAIYLNHIYLGHGAYGVGAAARTYSGKEIEDVTVAEAAMLAGLVASPTKYAPHRNMQLARERQRSVLGRMKKHRYISDAEHEAALAEPIALVDESELNHLASPYFVEHVRKLATARYGDRDLFKGGLKFYATLDSRMQAAAEGALRRGLESLDRKLGFRGPIGSVPAGKRGAWTGGPAHPLTGAGTGGAADDDSAKGPGELDLAAVADQVLPDQTYGAMVVELPRTGAGVTVDLGPLRLPLVPDDAREVRAWHTAPPRPPAGQPAWYVPPGWTPRTVKLGDLVPVRLTADQKAVAIAQRPALQGGMVVMEPHTGRVLAMVGGYDWTTSQFDRVTQARRQVGSSIKPFIYAAALEAGRTPVDHLRDGPF